MFIESNNMMYTIVQMIKNDAQMVESRLGPVKEMIDVSVTFEAGTFYTRPGMNPWIGWTEVAQLIAGTFDWGTFENVAPRSNLELFTANMAYGPRIKHQWEDVIAELALNPDSRRAVMYIGDQKESLFDRPCTNTVQFLIRKGHLITLVGMRSWDVFKGLPYDIMMFSALAQVTANILGVPAAEVVVTAGSAHVYESDFDRISDDQDKWKTKRMNIAASNIGQARIQMRDLDELLKHSESREERLDALDRVGIEVTDFTMEVE